MSQLAALVQPVLGATATDLDKRASVRHICMMEAMSHPLDMGDSICWGAIVRDISVGGLSLSLCFPFKPGTHLAIDLQGARGFSRTLLTRVLHVHDQADGAWLLGCEFVKPLTQSDMELLL